MPDMKTGAWKIAPNRENLIWWIVALLFGGTNGFSLFNDAVQTKEKSGLESRVENLEDYRRRIIETDHDRLIVMENEIRQLWRISENE